MSEYEMVEPKWDPKQFRKVTDEELNAARVRAYNALSPHTQENLRDAIRELPYHAQSAILIDALVAHVRFIEEHGASQEELDELRKRVDELDAKGGGKGKSIKDIFLGTLVRGIAQEVVERILSLPSLLGLQAATLQKQPGSVNRK